ncbi:MAG: hypothetical protein AB1656_04825 [Candidatus Omnitrophota bacterium]
MMAVLLGVILLLIGGIALALFTAPSAACDNKRILEDLGIVDSWAGEETVPFFKWGWHEEEEGRISAERIVKLAFQKTDLCLDADDLAFFENLCKRHQLGIEIKAEEVESRIQEIAGKAQIIRDWAAKEVGKSIFFVVGASPAETQLLLKRAGVQAEPDKAQGRLCAVEFQRLMSRLGMQFLRRETTGFIIEDSAAQKEIRLCGLDAWLQLIGIFKAEIERQSENQAHVFYPAVMRALKHIAGDGGLFQELERDVEKAKSFRKILSNSSNRSDFSMNVERAKQCDSLFYEWKYTEGVPFNQIDQNRFRDLLTNETLSPHFRQILLERIDEDIRSLAKLVNIFPRFVIFYGGTPTSRSFLCDQYSHHLMVLQETLSAVAKCEIAPPTILLFPEEEVEEVRKSPRRGPNAAHLDKRMAEKQSVICMELGLNQQVAETRGWLVNLGLNDPSDNEVEALGKDPFKRYLRFNCNSAGDVDFANNTFNARKSRVDFFNMALDSLVVMPPIQKKKGESNEITSAKA